MDAAFSQLRSSTFAGPTPGLRGLDRNQGAPAALHDARPIADLPQMVKRTAR